MRDYKALRLFDDETEDLDVHVSQILEERAKEKAAEEEAMETEVEVEVTE